MRRSCERTRGAPRRGVRARWVRPPATHARRCYRLLDHHVDVARRILDLCERKVALTEGRTHVLFRLKDVLQERTQPHRERVGLLLEKRVALLRAGQLDLHHLKVLPSWEHSKTCRRHGGGAKRALAAG